MNNIIRILTKIESSYLFLKLDKSAKLELQNFIMMYLCNLSIPYRLFNLSLVSLDLLLQLLHEVLHLFVVLAVFLGLEGQFFASSLSSSHVLLCLRVATLFRVELGFNESDAFLQLGDLFTPCGEKEEGIS